MIDKAFKATKFVALSALLFISGNTNTLAAPLSVAQTPLFLGATVQPNIYFVSDDSGSMDWETMMPPYWRYDAYDPDELRTGANSDNSETLITGGTWIAAEFRGDDSMVGGYGYIYGNDASGVTDNVYTRDCGHNTYRAYAEDCGDSTNSPLDVDWRVRASGLNSVFYNPNITYEPWGGPCSPSGPDCTDASYTAAKNDSFSTQPGFNITRNLDTDGDAQGGAFVYEVWIDDSGYTDTDGAGGDGPDAANRFDGTGVVNGEPAVANGWVDLWDTHIRIRVGGTTAIQATVERVTYGPQSATVGLSETVTPVATLNSATACYDVLGSKPLVKAAHASSVWTNTGATDCRTIAEARQDIANWYQYYRRRAHPVKNAVAAVINAQPNFRYGMTLINEDQPETTNDIFIEIPKVTVTDVTAHNTNIIETYFAYEQESNGTPLRTALEDAGEYYSGATTTDKPIVYSCQKNFAILFTDGYWNGTSPLVGEQDNDGTSNTVADVAYKYYKNDLVTTMANNVKLDADEDDLKLLATYDSVNNTTHQHMVTFTVAFGVTGALSDGDGDGNPDTNYAGAAWSVATPNIPEKNGNWGDASSDSDKIDDLWHAAFNTSGTFASASNPDEIADKLINAISNIAARISSAAAVALNSGTLNANSRVYQASFDSNDWSGSIKSIPIQDGPVDELPLGAPDGLDDSPIECATHPTLGELCDEEWDAAEKLAARTAASRDIFTLNSDTNAGVEFKVLADLGAAQQASLKLNPDTLLVETDAIAQQRLDYVRGDDSNEGSAAGEFRVRKVIAAGKTKLGDIIHSAPAYVAEPSLFYPDNLESASYNAYKIAKRNRTPMVYVGANDGMLHAFDASTTSSKGEEAFAYVPGGLIDKLPLLASQDYNSSHRYYVDGSPVTFDFFNGGWKTMLSSSLGAGGQLVYGLDITDPDTFGSSDVLWEFTDEPKVIAGDTFGDIDLGYVLGDVSYARMNNGQWVVIFGNGFNNTQADGNVSTTGNAVIYVVDALTGALVKKFDTQVGTAEDPSGNGRPNGISRVTPIDINGDFKADYLYAGDLFGNVWKMDVRSSSAVSWGSSYLSASKPKPFFIAKDQTNKIQPITTAVAVKRHPVNVDETLVLFGTGSYFQVNDAAVTQTQTFYSIWDDGTAAQYSRNKLLEQKILSVENVAGTDGITREFRVTSSAGDDAIYQIDWATDKGWYMDLGFAPDVGERVNVEPVLRGNRVIFVTLTPDPDPCNAGGSSWIMELNANDGNRLNISPFDVNGDGIIDDLDIVNFGGDDTITSGVRSKEGIVAKPGILNTKGQKELKFFSGTTGNIETVTESINLDQRDRQSWRQLR